MLRKLTPISNARQPGGAPVEASVNSLAVFNIGPLWHTAHAPFLLGGFQGASTKKSRPRFSEAVRPSGNAGGGPPAANDFSALLEKNWLSVCWNSAMALSWSAVGATVACACRSMAPAA